MSKRRQKPLTKKQLNTVRGSGTSLRDRYVDERGGRRTIKR